MKKIILFCLILFIIPPDTFGQNDQNPADFIMRMVAKKTADNEKFKESYVEYKRLYIIQDLNTQEQPTRTKKNEVELVTKGKGKIIERNGRPINGGSSSIPNINFRKALDDFYDFSMASTPVTMVDGRAYHVIDFRPTKGIAHPKGDMEEILSRMAGTIYIDVEKLFIYKLSANLTEEYSRGWFIYRLRRADIELVQIEFQNMVVVDSLKVTDKYSIFGVETFEKQTITYTDYAYKP